MHDFSVHAPDQPIDRIRAEVQQRDGRYIMPMNHFHPYYELYYLESGSCRFFLEDRMMDLKEGDLLLIPPRTVHFTRYLFGPCKRYNAFFRRTDLENRIMPFFPEQNGFFVHWQLVQIPVFYRDALVTDFEQMLSEERTPDERSSLLLHFLLQEMLLKMIRVGSILDAVPSDIHTTDQAIVRVAQFMRENYREPLTAKEIAAASGFSPNYLCRKFRQATGMGVHEYLSTLRLKEAALELTETRDSITVIATRCGFSDGNYFKDRFTKYYGCSPRKYRANAKSDTEEDDD